MVPLSNFSVTVSKVVEKKLVNHEGSREVSQGTLRWHEKWKRQRDSSKSSSIQCWSFDPWKDLYHNTTNLLDRRDPWNQSWYSHRLVPDQLANKLHHFCKDYCVHKHPHYWILLPGKETHSLSKHVQNFCCGFPMTSTFLYLTCTSSCVYSLMIDMPRKFFSHTYQALIK